MARNISAASLTKLETNLGTEPINIVEIQWVPSGPRDSYADRDIEGGIKGRILEIGGLDDVVQISGGGQSQRISLTLDDTDGSLKQILDTQDIHKRSCWVYQWFEGLATSEKFLIFRGEINSPVEWNEGDRTVRFDVISKIEDVEVGFSIEEGDFPAPPVELIGKPWPLCFGTVINVPALQTRSLRQGTLASGVGIKDFTLEPRISLAEKLKCPWVQTGWQGKLEPGGGFGPVFEEDAPCRQNACLELEKLKLQLTEQTAYEYQTIRIFGGDRFPQGQQLTLDIGGGKFNGSFNGDIFTITSRRHPDLDTTTGLPLVPPDERTIKSTCGVPLGTDQNNKGLLADFTDEEIEQLNATVGIFRQQIIQAAVSRKTWDNYNNYPTSSFFWANGGSTVTLENDEEIVYIVNLLPSTILRVAAYRTVNGQRRLLTVPGEYYTVRQSNFNTYQVMEVVFSRPLSRRDSGWEDDIFVTMTSTVGPNTVDILTWFIETYTDYVIDDASFDDVRAKIDNYPMNFALLERKNLINVLEEIAFQARCAIYLKDGTFFLKYLSEEPAADDTIGESDILAKSLTVSHTPTEDLVTKYVATWRKDYATKEPNTVILRHNVSKYGTHSQEYDYYCFNILELVRKTATFWLVRKANTWRKAKLSTPVSKLKLESFDTVGVTVPDIADGTIKALVESATYNSENHTIDFELWTPVKSGTRVSYSFAWPAQVEETLLFPTLEERDAGFAGSGDGPNFSVIAPVEHALNPDGPGGFSMTLPEQDPCFGSERFEPGTKCRQDYGDKNPSDIGDEKPEVDADEDQTGDISTSTSPITGEEKKGADNCCEIAKQALEEAKRALEEAAKANSDNSGNSRSKDDLAHECGGNCAATATVRWIKVSSVFLAAGGSSNAPGATGKIQNGDIHSAEQCYTFNSALAAQKFRDQIVEDTQTISDSYNAKVGSQYPWVTSTADPNLGLDTDPESENFNNACPEPSLDDQRVTGFTGDEVENSGVTLPYGL